NRGNRGLQQLESARSGPPVGCQPRRDADEHNRDNGAQHADGETTTLFHALSFLRGVEDHWTAPTRRSNAFRRVESAADGITAASARCIFLRHEDSTQ